MRNVAASLLTAVVACGGAPAAPVATNTSTVAPAVPPAPSAPAPPQAPPSEGKYSFALLYAGRSAVEASGVTGKLDECRAATFQASPAETGWATFTVRTMQTGEVASVSPTSARGLDSRSMDCVARALRTMERGVSAELTYVAYIAFR